MQSQVDQAGDIGGNGLSLFHWKTFGDAPVTQADVQSFHTALHAMYTALASRLPANMTWSILPEVKVFDSSSGALTSLTSEGVAQPTITGSSSDTGYPAGVGGRLNWYTNSIVNNRVLRGATFIIPLAPSDWTPSGSIGGPTQSALIGAGSGLISASAQGGVPFCVWHRPKKGQTSGGVLGQVYTVTVGTTPASLRSRRT
jgi:hypothetical protein